MTEFHESVNEPADPAGGGGLVRLRLDLGYDGAGFSGWAAQPGRRTVQGTLEPALGVLLRTDPVRTVVAGRTDAGVHAVGQVAHCDVARSVWQAWSNSLAPSSAGSASAESAGSASAGSASAGSASAGSASAGSASAGSASAGSATAGSATSSASASVPGERGQPVRRLAGLLPADLRVFAVTEVGSEFDARFAAIWRSYRYRICDRDAGPQPLRRHDTVHWRRQLDAPAMQQAGQQLLGLHDFAAFCRRRDGATTIRQLQRLAVGRRDDGTITVDVRADAFCHSMVRSLVGALAAVGERRRPVDWPASLLDQDRRCDEITVAPAHGLTLVEVGYPPADQLAARTADTRMVRTIGRREPGPAG